MEELGPSSIGEEDKALLVGGGANDDETMTTTTTTTIIRKKGSAPLKKEFILGLEELKKALGHVSEPPAGEEENETSSSIQGNGEDKKKQQKGHYKRPRGDVQGEEEERMCTGFLADRCAYGDKCKFTHDVEGYLRRKPQVHTYPPIFLPFPSTSHDYCWLVGMTGYWPFVSRVRVEWGVRHGSDLSMGSESHHPGWQELGASPGGRWSYQD